MPVVRTDDGSYKVRSTALVRNEDDGDGLLGAVLLSAKSTAVPCGVLGQVGGGCDNNPRHQFTARVVLRSGGTVTCSESRSHTWSGDGYEDIPLTCDKKLLLSDVKSVRIESS